MLKLVRVIGHWSVTTYRADDDCKRHYHYTLEGDGTEVAGWKRPEANLSTSDKDYCGHTLNCNQGSIGVACAAMWAPLKQKDIEAAVKTDRIVKAWYDGLPSDLKGKDFKQNERNPGPYPVTQAQFEAMCFRMAKCCKRYAIPVTDETVLMHGEVQKKLGIKQKGKWDIGTLPYANLWTIDECGDYMRSLTSKMLAAL